MLCKKVQFEFRTGKWRNLALLAALLFCSMTSLGQVQIGDDLKMHLSGDFGFNYSGNYGTYGSGHGTGFVGNGVLSGFFYDSRFLSFDVRPYYNRVQETSSIGLVSDSEGVTASTQIFSGSRFPGAFTYAKSHGNGSSYGVPGANLYTSDSSTSAMVVSWSLLFPNVPTFTATFSDTSSASSLVNASDITTNGKDLNLTSSYRWAGFDLQGGADFNKQSSKTPAFLQSLGSESASSGQYYTAQVAHALPLSGTWTAGYYRSNFSFDGQDSSANSFNTGFGMNPTSRLTVGAGMRYTGNLLNTMQRDLFGNPIILASESNSSSLSFDASASYRIFRGLSANGFVGQIRQKFNNREEVRNLYGGSATYMNSIPVLGYFRFSFALVDYYNNAQGNNGLGAFNLNGSLSRKFGKWDTSVDFAYGQSVVTKSSWATSSSYSYGGHFQRKFTPTVMIFGAYRGSQSAITLVEGTKNHAQSGTLGFNSTRFGISSTWTRTDGTAILTPAGIITPTPLAGLFTNDFMTYNSSGLGVSGSVYLFRGATITGGYDSTNGETNALTRSLNEANSYYLRLRYRVRKLVINGTYRRLDQVISASGAPPRDANSFSIQITRYFNVF